MVETGEDWIDLPDETPEAAASSLASGDVDPLAPFARDDEFLVAMLEERALQGYLWVTGTPFSLEYPSLRGGFGWHDISWKHHFQV